MTFKNKVQAYKLSHIDALSKKEKEKYCQEFLGTKELLDAETFIDPGFSVSSLNDDDEEVNIWTHVDSRASKEHYIVYQDWLYTDHES